MQHIDEMPWQGKWPPSDYPSAYVEGFGHWYLPENIDRIDQTLHSIKINSPGQKCLDIAFGNPIVLKRELAIFPECSGLYITLEKAFKEGIPASVIIQGNCYQIPFNTGEFDLVSAYALLHIIPDIPGFYKEAYRVLKKGGYLYTDGDKNISLTRVIRRFKLIQYRLTGDREKYKHWYEILQVKEDFHQDGIDYKRLKKNLKEIGFSKVIIKPWFSAKPEYNKNPIYRIIKNLMAVFKINLLFTHIQILAIK